VSALITQAALNGARRLDLIAVWTDLPDLVSINLSDRGGGRQGRRAVDRRRTTPGSASRTC
jgi:hypothetical protein